MNLNLSDWSKNWKILIIVNLFCLIWLQAQEKSEEEIRLESLLAQLASESWKERNSAFQTLAQYPQSFLLNKLLFKALQSSDAEVQILATQLWKDRLFLVPEELQKKTTTPFVWYPQYSIEKRKDLLIVALEKGEYWAVGFVLKILIYDPSLEIRAEAYQGLLTLLSQYSQDQLQEGLSYYFFVEETFWFDFVEGQFLLRTGKLNASKPFFEDLFQKLSRSFIHQQERKNFLDPTEVELLEEVGRTLAILAILEERFSIAFNYLTHPHLRLSPSLALDLFATQPLETIPVLLRDYFQETQKKIHNAFTEIHFEQEEDQRLTLEALNQTFWEEHIPKTSEETLKRWIPQLALTPEGIQILKKFFLSEVREEILTMTIAYLGYQKNPEDVKLLAPFLQHPSEIIQRFTLSALGHIGNDSAQKFLLDLIKTQNATPLLQPILENLAPSAEKDFIETLKPFLSHPEESILEQVIRLLPLSEVMSFRDHLSERVRCQVLLKFANTRNIQWYDVLTAFLKDTSDWIFEEALESLLAWNEIHTQLIPELKRLLEEEDYEALRKVYCKQALVRLGEKIYLESLWSEVNHSEEQIRLIALDFLVPWVTENQNIETLESCFRDPSSEIRASVVGLLKGVSSPEVILWMKRLLFDSHHSVQFQALQNLEFLENPEFKTLIEFTYRDLLEAYPEHDQYQLAWATWLWKQKKIISAQLEAEYLVALNPESVDANHLLLKIYHHTNQRQERDRTARCLNNHYQEEILKKPELKALLWNNWAWALVDARVDLEKAGELAEKALQISRESYILDTKAEILMQQNKQDEAKKLLYEALQSAENLPMKIELQKKLLKLK